MQETFLHFVWQHQAFNQNSLRLHAGESLEVLKIGHHNQKAGPDFLESMLRVSGLQWAGSIEIHIRSSDWHKHGHTGDPNYANVVLHVVYEHDAEVLNPQGEPLPTLELKGLIKPLLKTRYEQIMAQHTTIACRQQLITVKSITKLSMLENALVERLMEKSLRFKQLIDESRKDWEEATYQWLAQGFGFKSNAENMLNLAKAVPLRVLRKHQDPLAWEALLYGASGLLNVKAEDNYMARLQQEYEFLQKKYGITSSLSYNQWHFSGVRPPNFPTLRIAQLIAFVMVHANLFALFTDFSEVAAMKKGFEIVPGDYWLHHYRFGLPAKKPLKGMSRSAQHHLLINTVAPLLMAYADYEKDGNTKEKAMSLLMSLPKEKNKIIKEWMDLGWNINSAFDSQGLIQLYNQYCQPKRCIECKIGTALVKGS